MMALYHLVIREGFLDWDCGLRWGARMNLCLRNLAFLECRGASVEGLGAGCWELRVGISLDGQLVLAMRNLKYCNCASSVFVLTVEATLFLCVEP